MTCCPDCDSVRVSLGAPCGNGLCAACHGTGKGLISGLNEKVFGEVIECSRCDGSRQCQTCHGAGIIEDDSENEIDVRYPGTEIEPSDGFFERGDDTSPWTHVGSSVQHAERPASGLRWLPTAVVAITFLGAIWLLGRPERATSPQQLAPPFPPQPVIESTSNPSTTEQALRSTVQILNSGLAEGLRPDGSPTGVRTVFVANEPYGKNARQHVTYFASFRGAIPQSTRFDARVFYNDEDMYVLYRCGSSVANAGEGMFSCQTGPYYLQPGRYEIRLFVNSQEASRSAFEIVQRK